MATKPVLGSCRDCQHYGWLVYRWVCGACASWNRTHPPGDCTSCGRRDGAVLKGHCRACWKEASHRAGPLNTKPLFTASTRFASHQLALTGIWPRPPAAPTKRRPHRPPRQLPSAGTEEHAGQLALFRAPPTTGPMPSRHHNRQLIGRSTDVRELKLGTFWTLQAVDQHAQAHGWTVAMRLRARATLIAALNERPVGDRVTRRELHACGGPAHLLAPVLADLDLLAGEPCADPLPRLIDKRAAGLPDAFRTDVAAWMRVLRDGDARSRPRSWKTVVEYSRNVRPLLLAWGRRHQHLREITSTDIHQALATVPAGSARQNTFVATRALFRFLRRHLGSSPTPPATSTSAGVTNRPSSR